MSIPESSSFDAFFCVRIALTNSRKQSIECLLSSLAPAFSNLASAETTFKSPYITIRVLASAAFIALRFFLALFYEGFKFSLFLGFFKVCHYCFPNKLICFFSGITSQTCKILYVGSSIASPCSFTITFSSRSTSKEEPGGAETSFA